MNQTEINCALDRIEGDIAVLIPDEGKNVLEVPARLADKVREGEKCILVLNEGVPFEIKPMVGGGDAALRLQRLFDKSKEKKKEINK